MSIQVVDMLLNRSGCRLGEFGAGMALYHALDAAHGWHGNGGQHHALWPIQGYVSPSQLLPLQRLAGRGPIQICQIGFNAGHSASQFLCANPAAKLLSFDLAENAYVQKVLHQQRFCSLNYICL